MAKTETIVTLNNQKDSFRERLRKDYKKNKLVIFMMLPIIAYYIIFHYIPMYGVIISFKNFDVAKGLFASEWVGLRHFREFFTGYYAWRVIRNTILLSLYQLIFGFPFPIILAILLNEVSLNRFKKTVQTVTYLPHFISAVVICGMVVEFTSINGLVNDIVEFFGGERVSYLLKPEFFRPVYVATNVWQNFGWDSIIYLAALASVDQELYEAAYIDGANRFKRLLNVTLPAIVPTIVVLLILNIGKFMSQGAEKIILLYNENTFETADVIASFVYRRGLINADYSFSAAVGLFNSVINLVLIITTNNLSRRFSESSLW